jgi:hypothetical protein
VTLAARRKRDAGAFRSRSTRPIEEPATALTVIDATTIDEPANSDEALAQAVEYAQPGDVITLHDAGCPTTRDKAWRCRCKPIALEVGAKA